MRNTLVFAALCLLVAVTPVAADREAYREQSEKAVEVRGFGTLDIINARGRIDLVASPDVEASPSESPSSDAGAIPAGS